MRYFLLTVALLLAACSATTAPTATTEREKTQAMINDLNVQLQRLYHSGDRPIITAITIDTLTAPVLVLINRR